MTWQTRVFVLTTLTSPEGIWSSTSPKETLFNIVANAWSKRHLSSIIWLIYMRKVDMWWREQCKKWNLFSVAVGFIQLINVAFSLSLSSFHLVLFQVVLNIFFIVHLLTPEHARWSRQFIARVRSPFVRSSACQRNPIEQRRKAWIDLSLHGWIRKTLSVFAQCVMLCSRRQSNELV